MSEETSKAAKMGRKEAVERMRAFNRTLGRYWVVMILGVMCFILMFLVPRMLMQMGMMDEMAGLFFFPAGLLIFMAIIIGIRTHRKWWEAFDYVANALLDNDQGIFIDKIVANDMNLRTVIL